MQSGVMHDAASAVSQLRLLLLLPLLCVHANG
jgi:hypothetical protein